MKQKRIFCALLAGLMLMASCGSTGSGTTGDNGTTAGGDTTPTETTKPGLISKLTPELKEELGLDGYEFNVFLRAAESTWSLKDIVAEEENGETLNDAVSSSAMSGSRKITASSSPSAIRLTRRLPSSRPISSRLTTATTLTSRWAEPPEQPPRRDFFRI